MEKEHIEKIIEQLNSPEGLERMKKHFEEYQRKQEIRNKKKLEMVSNTEYLDWAISYLEKKISNNNRKYFSNDYWFDFDPEKVTEDENKKILDLNLFFDAIKDYADRNNIEYEIYSDREIYYRISYKGKLYDVGEYSNPEFNQSFSMASNSEAHIINFEDIIKDALNVKKLTKKKKEC